MLAPPSDVRDLRPRVKYLHALRLPKRVIKSTTIVGHLRQDSNTLFKVSEGSKATVMEELKVNETDIKGGTPCQ
jgi:hypothetical protein